MDWKRLLGYITGSVNEDLLLRNEFLAEENRILRSKLGPRVRLTDPERIRLATIGKKLGLKALEGLSAIVKPATILTWHRKLSPPSSTARRCADPGAQELTPKLMRRCSASLARTGRGDTTESSGLLRTSA